MSYKSFVNSCRIISQQILIMGAVNPFVLEAICDAITLFMTPEMKGIGSLVISSGFLITRPSLRCLACYLLVSAKFQNKSSLAKLCPLTKFEQLEFILLYFNVGNYSRATSQAGKWVESYAQNRC